MPNARFNSEDFIELMRRKGYSSRVHAEGVELEYKIPHVATAAKLWLCAKSIEFIAGDKPLEFRRGLFHSANLDRFYYDPTRKIIAYRMVETAPVRYAGIPPFVWEAWHTKPAQEFLDNLKQETFSSPRRPKMAAIGLLVKILRQENKS